MDCAFGGQLLDARCRLMDRARQTRVTDETGQRANGVTESVLGDSRGPLCIEIPLEQCKAPLPDGLSDCTHKHYEIMDIVDGIQAVRKEFFCHKKMAQIRSAIVPAGVA